MASSSFSTTTTMEQQQQKKPIVNFSRPRQLLGRLTQDEKSNDNVSSGSGAGVGAGNVRTMSAFHEPKKEVFPDEPQFDLEGDGDEQAQQVVTPSTVSSDFAWDAKRGELVSREGLPSQSRTLLQSQRHPPPQQRTHTNSSSGSSARKDSSYDTTPPSTADSLKRLMPKKSILKSTSVEQYSERVSSEMGEDTRSHHTASEEGGGREGAGGRWTSSEFDTSELSEKEMKKLEKKGINPSLYLEMKEARKGKSCVGGLTGNAYVS